MAATGSITLNGISDKEMVRIWEYKAKDGKNFTFQPNAMQPLNGPQNQFTGFYNNVVFSWRDDEGLKIVHEIIGFLLKKEQQATAANQ